MPISALEIEAVTLPEEDPDAIWQRDESERRSVAMEIPAGDCVGPPRLPIWAGLGRAPARNPTAERTGTMQTFIIVIHLMIVLAMVGLVLLQKSEGGGLGIGSSGGLHVQPRHHQCAHPQHRLPGGLFLRHQPDAVGPGRLEPQSGLDPAYLRPAQRRERTRRAAPPMAPAAACSNTCRTAGTGPSGPQVPQSK